jgi:hypothetical protein
MSHRPDGSPSGLPQGVGLHQLALVAMAVSIFDNLDFERAVEETRRVKAEMWDHSVERSICAWVRLGSADVVWQTGSSETGWVRAATAEPLTRCR